MANPISQALEGTFKSLRTKIFGANNERLDFLLDSFYKLSPGQRSAAIASGVVAVCGFILAAVILYFAQAQALESELGNSIAALQEVKRAKSRATRESRRFDELSSLIRKRATINFKPFFEKVAQSKDISVRDISEKSESLPSDDPLSAKFSRTAITINFPKISIPRMLAFVTDVEKSGHYLRLRDIKVTGQYGNKLYFDTEMVFLGYSRKR